MIAGCLGSATIGRASPPAPGYELLYADEFNGDRLNEADWSYRTGRRTVGTWLNGMNLAKNVSVSGGKLHVAVRTETIDGKTEFTGGGVISTHRFGFGYYECRSRPFMAGKGVHSAFWQRGTGKDNSFFEIDSYELDSTEHIATNNLYVDLSDTGHGLPWPHRSSIPLHLPADGWFVDAYEYTPDGVIFYDQGVKVAEAEFPDLIGQQNVWLTALNGIRGTQSDRQPGESTFDYFRYYAKDYPGVNFLPNGSFEYNFDKNPQRPIAWEESGDADASFVANSPHAAHGDYVLRQSAARPYRVATTQTLEFIRNGEYELLARVRRAGKQTVAQLRVSGTGGAPTVAEIPVTDQWQLIHLRHIPVENHTATIEVVSAGGPGDWLEVDDMQFMKPPLPGQSRRPSRIIGKVDESRDPRWQIAQRVPIVFTGDDRFYFFSPNVGAGEAITVTMSVTVPSLTNTIPLSRQSRNGTGGWAVRFSETGDIAFCIGGAKQHREIVARGALKPQHEARITCVLDHGVARIFVDGVERAAATGIRFTATNPDVGRLGASQNAYQAAGDIMQATAEGEAQRRSTPKLRNFVGTLRDLRIYNCALPIATIPASDRPQK